MLKNILNLFTPEQAHEEVNHEERVKLATCVLLLEAAKADDDFDQNEKAHIINTMTSRFSLSTGDAHELIESAANHRDGSIDLWQYTKAINNVCTRDEKEEILEEIWRVIMTDGGIHGHETHLIRQLAKLLNLTHDQLITAKMKVLEEFRNKD